MVKQWPLTDAAVAALRAGVAAAGGTLGQVQRQNLTPPYTKLNSLARLRAAAGNDTMSPLAVFQAYNAIVDAEFQFLRSQAEIPNGSIALYQEGVANIDGGQALELVGREASLVGGSLAAGGTMSAAIRQQFTQDVYDQRLLEQNALSPLNWPGIGSPYTHLFASALYTRFAALENSITDGTGPGGRLPVSAAAWQSSVQSFLTEFTRVSILGREADTKGAAHAGDVILLRLILVGGAGLVAVVISGLLLVRFGRRMTRELTGFLAAVRALADERLPLVVRRLRAGERVDIAAEAQPLALRASTREATEIAEAFSTVQRTAVEAAVGEAELRSAASVVFRSLARRSQSLLQRQLGLLADMERDASDPGALEQLFRLDHLTTRMRRHAEGLIVLSGAPSGRRWRDPVPLVEVLRGAIGEIEDRGLGIPPPTLAALNDRLANPPEFDLADTDQLGLFVVSRLAARQEIRVSLRGSPFGGTLAIVLLPRRSPQANLAPQLREAPPARSADQARTLIASIRQGWRNGGTETGGPTPATSANDNEANDDGERA